VRYQDGDGQLTPYKLQGLLSVPLIEYDLGLECGGRIFSFLRLQRMMWDLSFSAQFMHLFRLDRCSQAYHRRAMKLKTAWMYASEELNTV
jgi:hypothetical protein